MKLALLTALNAARAARQAAVLVTNMTSHAQRLVLGHEVAADALAWLPPLKRSVWRSPIPACR